MSIAIEWHRLLRARPLAPARLDEVREVAPWEMEREQRCGGECEGTR
ncbi:MAG: hypothetical protein M0004_09975 [Actinomycetota bacterium]|nr:hypothetical protein [Actinomycetota bacterium]